MMMAHQLLSHEEIDTAAAAAAAQVKEQFPELPAPMATLAYGAGGEFVTKLVDLLALLGYDTNNVIKGAPPILDESVLVDVRAAKAALDVAVPELTEPAAITVGVEGELVDEATWSALYAAAEAKLEAAPAAAPADAAGGASVA
jgi:hypothetical protein